MSVKHPTPFYGGALDGATTTRRAAYLDNLGAPISAARGDRAWCHTAIPTRFYARCYSPSHGCDVYVHWSLWESWRAKESA